MNLNADTDVLIVGAGPNGLMMACQLAINDITIARDLVRTTDRAFNLFSSANLFLRTFRLYIIPIGLKLVAPVFLKFKPLQRLAFKTVSEIGISYRKNFLSKNASLGKFPGHAPRPGDRLPFMQFENANGEKTNIQEKVKGKFFNLFIFSDKAPKEFLELLQPFRSIISIETIPFTVPIVSEPLGAGKGVGPPCSVNSQCSDALHPATYPGSNNAGTKIQGSSRI